ncbi:CYANIDIN-3-O-GLUCOSIDE 2-O-GLUCURONOSYLTRANSFERASE-LIKE [Salix viminalis]|uniref:CYANIDIN-3-O-GLUCOSIDE 2-O-GLUCURONOSYLTRANSFERASE-LIKE n=1 Tax=Salix viminalis TaxID=40686 RepID=A0A9Q0NT11_SALVM|nr:CYANIDIN-3-O-GLUCOSIDE 2-O-GLUCURONOSYLTRANSFERASE-LIKE [Salix viminalis]
MEYLKIAYDLLKHPLKQFIADQLPDWIIIDMMPYWMVDIARENKVPLIHFSIFSAVAYVFLCHPGVLGWRWSKRLRPSWDERIYGENASGSLDGERIFGIRMDVELSRDA